MRVHNVRPSEKRAQLYSLLHTGNPGDIPFYLRQCAGIADVLEMGCGTGRVSLPLARSGVRVVGVDTDDAMLAELTRNGTDVVSSQMCVPVSMDMRRFLSPQRFDRVIIPYNSLLCLLSEIDVVQALKTAAQHLRCSGEVVFDIYNVPEWLQNRDHDPSVYSLCSFEYDDEVFHVTEQAIHHRDPQRFDTCYFFAGDRGSYEEVTIRQRCICPNQLNDVLDAAGLTCLELSGDFHHGPFDCEKSDTMVVRAGRPYETIVVPKNETGC